MSDSETLGETTSGQLLGKVIAYGVESDEDGWDPAASISFVQDGASTATRVPGAIAFNTTDGVTREIERMRIDSDGTTSFYGNVDVSGGALLLSSIVSAGLGGTTEESAVEVDITGKNNVKLSPDDDEKYFKFSGTPHDGQIVVVSNITSSFVGYMNGNALGASSAALFIYVGDGVDEWRIL